MLRTNKLVATLSCAFLTLWMASAAPASEYFVGVEGSDENDGMSRDFPFRTIQRGVDALKPGDTLTIAPGEYLESVRRDELGNLETETVIRAEIPGTVLLRGDVPLPPFRRVEGYRFVYVTDLETDYEVQAVSDLDALVRFRCVPGVPGLEFRPGSFSHVPEESKVYISTADLSSPDGRRFTATVNSQPGLELTGAKRVRIEGLSVTGFHNHGIRLDRTRQCVVADCRAYLNAGGINVDSARLGADVPGENVIERCAAWANHGNGLSARSQNRDTIRDSVAFLNGNIGMNLYSGPNVPSRMAGNLSWGNHADFQMKSGVTQHVVERCVGPGFWPHESGNDLVSNSLVGVVGRGRGDGYRDNIYLAGEEALDLHAEFADPDNHDYRLQATSRFRGAADDGGDLGPFPYEETIYYVCPEGDDQADGLSVSSAWASLERAAEALGSGDTLYLLPGRHDGALRLSNAAAEGGPIRIRGRGTEPVVMAGPLEAQGVWGMRLERLRFLEAVVISGGGDARVEQCAFNGNARLTARDVDGLHVTHCAFSGDEEALINLSGSEGVYLSGNRFDNSTGLAVSADNPDAVVYTDYNAYLRSAAAWGLGEATVSADRLPRGWERYGTVGDALASATGPYGRAAGPYAEDPGLEFRLVGPIVHAAGATSANIEWYASHHARITLDWGTTPACEEGRITDLERFDTEAEQFGSISLRGLEPNTRYYVRLRSVEPLDTPREINSVDWSTEPVSFTTAQSYREPARYHVAPDGDDGADGLSPGRALRTITRAAYLARPGDWVEIAGGVYKECLYVRATGLPERPITFVAKLGDRVTLDGGPNRELDSLIVGFDKSHVRLDGFYMTNVSSPGTHVAGVIRWFGGEDVRITRMLFDGRVGWSRRLFAARRVSDLLVRNSLSINTMGGPAGRNCPHFRMENSILLRNRIGGMPFGGAGRPESRAVLRANIITDCQANKIHQAVPPLAASDTLVLEDNAFFLRPERRIQMDRGMNMAEFEEQVLRDGGMLCDPRFAGLYLDEHDFRAQRFGPDRFFGMERELTFADMFATNPEFVRRGIGFDPDAFRGFDAGPLSTKHLIALADDLPPHPGDEFGRRYRERLASLRDRAASQPPDSLRHELRHAFVEAEWAREARRDAGALLAEARETLARPYIGDAKDLHNALADRIEEAAAIMEDGQAELESLRKADRMLRRAVAQYDAGRLIQVRLPHSGWRFRTDPQDAGRDAAWFAPDHDDGNWRTDVPIERNWQDFRDSPYFGAAWYRRSFDAPEMSTDGVKVILVFQGVDEEAWVWLNGAYVGSHEMGPGGWDVPFQVDVTDAINPGGSNQITVLVRNTAGQGGIWQPVHLNVRDGED